MNHPPKYVRFLCREDERRTDICAFRDEVVAAIDTQRGSTR